MSLAETIAAAIEKLEAHRDAASPSPWDYAGQGWVRHGDPTIGSDQFPEVLAAETRTDADGVLIVTLHRTIDAQLAILRAGASCLQMGRGGEPVGSALILARAIIGEEK